MTTASLILIPVFLLLFLVFRRTAAKSTLDARRARIKSASLVFQALIGACLLLGIYSFLAFLFGWPSLIHDKLRIVISDHHIYGSPADMPATILALWMVKTCLGFCCAGMMLRLFWLYGRGILFSARNVTCIRFLGWWLMINWVIDYQMQSWFQDMDLSMTPCFVGLLIIFVAWIMDEGRKIEEEQELTV